VKTADDIQTVPATTPLLEVIDLLSEQVPALAVVKPEDGSVLGLLEKSSILMAMQKKSEAQPA